MMAAAASRRRSHPQRRSPHHTAPQPKSYPAFDRLGERRHEPHKRLERTPNLRANIAYAIIAPESISTREPCEMRASEASTGSFEAAPSYLSLKAGQLRSRNGRVG